MHEFELEVLYEAAGLPSLDLPDNLVDLYGGPLGFEEPVVVANFVASLDGVVAAPPVNQSARLVSADSAADKFVVGLLRAVADVIVVGSGTLQASPGSTWTPAEPYPAAAASFAELRDGLGRPEHPRLVVLTGTGLVDPSHPALARDALVLTTDRGATRLAGRLPDASELVSLGDSATVSLPAAFDLLRQRGYRLVLSEVGPHIFGGLIAAGLVDELFLTISPVLAGREAVVERFGLVEGRDLLPRGLLAKRLLGVRRDGAYLFLRYRLRDDA